MLDNSSWLWDCRAYGSNAVSLYADLINFSSDWFHDLFYITRHKATMICWLGQFFVPIGKGIGSIDKGLLLMIYMFLVLSLYLFYKSLNEIFKSPFISFIGCLVIIAAPLAFSLSTAFLVEPIQLFAVVWFIYIFVFSEKWDKFYIFLQLISAASFAMMVKVSSPIYCMLPGVIILYRLFASKAANYIGMKKKHWLLLIIAVLLGTGCSFWYRINWGILTTFVIKSSSAKRWGSIDLFHNKLGYWLYSSIDSFFMPYAFCFFLLLFLIALFVYIKKKHILSLKSNIFLISCPISGENLLVAMGLIQIAGVLFIFCNAVNECNRYLLPLLPYVAILIAWSLHRLKKRWISILISLILISQLSISSLEAFNFINPPDFPFAKLTFKWKKKLNTDKLHIKEYDVVHEKLKCVGGNINVVVDHTNSNIRGNDISYYLQKKMFPEQLTCNFLTIWRIYENKKIAPDKLFRMFMDRRPVYYIVEQPKSEWALRTYDKFNNSGALLEKVKKSGEFKQIPSPEYPNLLIFKYVGEKW